MHRQNWFSRTVRRVLSLGDEQRRAVDRRRRANLAGERLEDRRVMAGGLGLQFNIAYTASVPAQVKTAFQTAADHWSSILTDDITVNVSVDFTSTAAGVGQTLPVSLTKPLSDVRTALDADRRSVADDTAVAHLPVGAGAALYTTDFDTGLPLLDDNDTDNNQVLLLTRANAKALGLVPPTSPSSDGTIKFLSTVVYDYDPSNGIGAGRYDFIGVAMHEIGHLLGFVSGADVVDLRSKQSGPAYNAGIDQDNYIVARPLDLFRQSTDAIAAGADFDLRADKAPKFLSLDHGATQLGEFSTGVYNGNGRENQHWKDNLNLGIMDPTLALAEAAKLSALDVLTLDVIGWDPRMDYGDAPDSTAGAGPDDYRTLRSGDGPRHGLFAPTGLGGDFEGTPRVYLGTGVDRELDGQPDAAAQGDDAHGADDESGIAAMPPLVVGKDSSVSIASSASGARPAQLDYFVDFNRDGDFDDAGETFHATLVGSPQSVPLNVPVAASLGETIVRLRISSAGGLGPNGPAADGEVEDYRANVVAPPAPLVSDASTLEDQLSAPIVIERAPNQAITYFRVSAVVGGSLFLADGLTPIADGSFVTYADGHAGLRFLPSPDSVAPGGFVVESSQDGATVAPGSGSSHVTIVVTPMPDAPRALALSNATILENAPVGTFVGQLSAFDPDLGDSLAFAFASGPGDGDNAKFTLSATGELRLATALDYETQQVLQVRVRSVDSTGLAVERDFAISVLDVLDQVDVWGTSGDDSFTVAYSTSDVTVSRGVNGSAETLAGVYPAGVTVRVHGQEGNDRLALVVVPTQLGDWTTPQLVTLKDYMAASTGKTLTLEVPGVGAMQSQDLETARLLVDDDQQRYDLSACLPSITSDAQIQIGGAGDDVLVGTNQVDLIFGQGGADLLYALDGADWLFGGAGADLIYGGNADDQLWGGSGDDYLNGGAGADRLAGGDGVDTVTTGAGRDVISFVGDQASIDVVTDFALYYDVLDLRAYQTSYAQLTYDFATYPGETLIHVAGGKKIRLANWTTFVGVGQVVV